MNRPRVVLVTEDDDDHAALIVRILEKGPVDARIERVANGEEAVRFLEETGAPELLFLDLKLPLVDGFEVLRRVREDLHLSGLPVVVLTTSDTPGDRERAYALGANSYLIKGTDPSEFRQMLTETKKYWLQWNRSGA